MKSCPYCPDYSQENPVGDVINSRASDSAKLALRNMLYPPVLIPKTTETLARYFVV